MDFTTLSEKIYAVCTYDVYKAFYATFKNCIVSDFNLVGFCDAFNVDINLINQ